MYPENKKVMIYSLGECNVEFMFLSRLLGPVSDHVLMNRVNKERDSDYCALYRDILNYFLFMLLLMSVCYQEIYCNLNM